MYSRSSVETCRCDVMGSPGEKRTQPRGPMLEGLGCEGYIGILSANLEPWLGGLGKYFRYSIQLRILGNDSKNRTSPLASNLYIKS